MKHLLFLSLLIGCVSSTTIEPNILFKPEKVAFGTNGTVDWKCYQRESNDKIVWISCQFKNTSIEKQDVCIKVSYYLKTNENVLDNPVCVGRPICSGPISNNEEQEKSMLFVTKNRETLTNICGINLNKCIMIADLVE